MKRGPTYTCSSMQSTCSKQTSQRKAYREQRAEAIRAESWKIVTDKREQRRANGRTVPSATSRPAGSQQLVDHSIPLETDVVPSATVELLQEFLAVAFGMSVDSGGEANAAAEK